MRTPSLYSQDDPISAALKPPSTETETERDARLLSEAEARRVSEQIDEDLRLERERMKRNRGDVKVRTRSLYFSAHICIEFRVCRSYCYSDRLRAANQRFKNSSN